MSNIKQTSVKTDFRTSCVDKLAHQAAQSNSPQLRRELLKSACQLLESELFPGSTIPAEGHRTTAKKTTI